VSKSQKHRCGRWVRGPERYRFDARVAIEATWSLASVRLTQGTCSLRLNGVDGYLESNVQRPEVHCIMCSVVWSHNPPMNVCLCDTIDAERLELPRKHFPIG
jgi:hypothetical protein